GSPSTSPSPRSWRRCGACCSAPRSATAPPSPPPGAPASPPSPTSGPGRPSTRPDRVPVARAARPPGLAALARSDQAVLVGEDDDLYPVAQRQLAQDRADVGLHRRLAGEDGTGDLRVGQPPGHRGEHLALLVGEREEPDRRRYVGLELPVQQRGEV